MRAHLRLLPWLVLPILIGLAGWGWWRGVEAARASRRELGELTERKAQLEDSVRRLRREVTALQREKEARARAARQALDVAAADEVLVVVPEPTKVR